MTDKAISKFASILAEADTSPIVADPHDDPRALVDSPRGWTRSRIRALVWAMLEARANTKGWVMPTPIARADQALRDALDGLRYAIAAGECEALGVAAVDHPANPAESAEEVRVQGLRDVEAARATLLSLGFTSLGSGVWAGDDSQACVEGGTVSLAGEFTPAQLRALATLAEQEAS
jgi:hypothetical protein